MIRRLPGLALAAIATGLLFSDVPAQEGGYTFNRLVLWSDPGDAYPRLERDSGTGALSVLFPGVIPETGWDPIQARRLVMHGPAFVPAEPREILRPRDADPDWSNTSSEASLDLNRDGIPEVVLARTVMIPDNRDPMGAQQRVLVQMREGDLLLFGDLLEGPGGDPVEAHSVSVADLTGDGYPDMLVRLESKGRGALVFYSQAPLRYERAATRIISGFSPQAFHPDRYGIFDLSRTPRDFFSRLPPRARTGNPQCASGTATTESDGRGHCRFIFDAPYLGWIREFRVEFIPNRRIVSFELFFPSGNGALDPAQAMELLTPVLGGSYRKEAPRDQESDRQLWTWRAKGATAQLSALEAGGKTRAVSLRLERN